MITIFTDGSCNYNKLGTNNLGGYSFVLINENGIKISEGSGKEEKTSNNRMELRAVIESLKACKNSNEEIIVCSDSQYVVNAINQKWLLSWRKNEYKKGKRGKEVPNKDLWEELFSLLKPNIKFKWVEGHNKNNVWNEYCDRMARKAYERKFTIIK